MPSMLHYQSAQQIKFQNAVNLLRSAGVSHDVSLPQIVACGDQSSGKSSVMEAITGGIPFPTSDGLCTRYPTEIVCRNWDSPDLKIVASIIPERSRTATKQAALKQFHAEGKHYDDIKGIIAKVNEAINLDEEGRGFSADVLRIELYSAQVSNLTIIDLPGLFHSGVATQTSDDCAFVRDLVEDYITRPRTLILAVLHTKVDPSSQIILELAQKVDPKGERTLGIITKPDTLSMESEPTTMENFITLALNTNRPLDLGYHVLKNRAHQEKHFNSEERDRSEKEFFLNAPRWKDLPKDITGINALDQKLTQLSCRSLEENAADLIPEITKVAQQLREQESNLVKSSYTERKVYTALFTASSKFNFAVDRIFQGHPTPNDNENLPVMKRIDNIVTTFGQCLKDVNHARAQLSSTSPPEIEHHLPLSLSGNELITHVEQEVASRTYNMPGYLDMDIVSELFYDSAKAWSSLVENMVSAIVTNMEQCLRNILSQVLTDDPQLLNGVYRQLLGPVLENLRTQLLSRGGEILQGHVSRERLSQNPQCYPKVVEARAMYIRALSEWRLSQFDQNMPSTSGLHGRAQESLNRDQLLEGVFHDAKRIESSTAREIIAYMEEHYQFESRKLISHFDFPGVWSVIRQHVSSILSPSVIQDLNSNQLREMVEQEAEDSAERTLLRTHLQEVESALQHLSEIPQRPSDANRSSSDTIDAPPAKRARHHV